MISTSETGRGARIIKQPQKPHPTPLRDGLADRLRENTRALHAQVERSGIIAAIRHGRADRRGYCLLLRNLLPVYQTLEAGLSHHAQAPAIGALAKPALFRTQALTSDLGRLCGTEWRETLPLLSSAERYRQAIAEAAEGEGTRLIAHAYVRYLGDLSGGQVVRELLRRSLGLQPDQLGFYDFPAIPDLGRFKADYRLAIDQAGWLISDPATVAEEAALAFRLNIALSEAVSAPSADQVSR